MENNENLSVEKQIEEMVKDMCNHCDKLFGYHDECKKPCSAVYQYADALYNAGYRKYPCGIGDTVYCIWQYSDFAKIDPPFILEDKVIGFVIDEGIIKPIPHHFHQFPDWYTLRDIKFTQEEAEKILAKMKGGE